MGHIIMGHHCCTTVIATTETEVCLQHRLLLKAPPPVHDINPSPVPPPTHLPLSPSQVKNQEAPRCVASSRNSAPGGQEAEGRPLPPVHPPRSLLTAASPLVAAMRRSDWWKQKEEGPKSKEIVEEEVTRISSDAGT